MNSGLFRRACLMVLLTSVIVLAACEKAADVRNPLSYAKDGINFKYPSNWTVSEDVEDEGYRYIFIDTPGDSTMIFQVYVRDEALELREFAEWFSGEMRTALPVGEAGQSTFTDHERTVGERNLNGLIEEFPVTFLGEKVEQKHEYFRIDAGKRVVFLIASGPKEDLGMVSPGFDLVFRTVQIEYREPDPVVDDVETPSGNEEELARPSGALKERIRKHSESKE